MTQDLRSDEELLRDAASDPEAFGVLYDRHFSTTVRFFLVRTASAETSADLAAETFAQAFLSKDRYDPSRGVVAAWLFGIARNQLRRYQRKQRVEDRARRRLGVEPIEVDDESIRRIEELIDFAPLAAAVRQAMAELSPQVAQAVLMRVGHRLPYAEVARQLGCSEGAARVRVSRGLARLADALGKTP